MPRTDSTAAQRGFTVIELMIVIGIMATVIAIAAVSVGDSLRKSRLQNAAREIEGEFETIRNTARTLQRRVTAQVTATRVFAFYDNNNNGTYEFNVDYVDSNQNGIYDDGIDASGIFLGRTYSNGVQLAVTSLPGVGVIVPVTTIQFNEFGNIIDDNRVITVSMNGEANRLYRVWIFRSGSTRVERSDNGGLSWPMRPW